MGASAYQPWKSFRPSTSAYWKHRSASGVSDAWKIVRLGGALGQEPPQDDAGVMPISSPELVEGRHGPRQKVRIGHLFLAQPDRRQFRKHEDPKPIGEVQDVRIVRIMRQANQV